MTRDTGFKGYPETTPMKKSPNHHGDGYYGEHPSFGIVELSRVTGRMTNMVGVDFPQGHAIKLTINTARMERNIGTTRWDPRKVIAEVYLSEVQFASLITNMNAGGVPGTLRRYCSETPITPGDPPEHMLDVDGLADETQEPIDEGMEALEQALAAINDPKFSKKNTRELLEKALRELGSNREYRVSQGKRTIRKAADRAKQEIVAFAEHTVRAYGLRNLGADMALVPGIEQNEGARALPGQEPSE